MCFRCNRPKHKLFQKCNSQIDPQFDQWAKEKNVKFCKVCFAKLEKISGCNHITCSYCKYEFCWLCERPYNGLSHYNPENIFGCPNQLFTEYTKC